MVCAAIDWTKVRFIEKPLIYKYGNIIDDWEKRIIDLDIRKLFI